MKKIDYLVMIADRLAKHKLEPRCFLAMCRIAEMNDKKQVVTRSALHGRLPCDVYFLTKRLLEKELIRGELITGPVEGVHGSCVEQYFLTAKAINLLKAVLE